VVFCKKKFLFYFVNFKLIYIFADIKVCSSRADFLNILNKAFIDALFLTCRNFATF